MIAAGNKPPTWSWDRAGALNNLLEAALSLFMLDRVREAAGTTANATETALRDELRNHIRDVLLPAFHNSV